MTIAAVVIGGALALILIFAALQSGRQGGLEPISQERLAEMKGPLLLVVEGSLTIQKVIELAFLKDTIHPVGVTTAEEAIELLEARGFLAALVNVSLPGMDGYDLCSEIKRQKPALPVILLTGRFETFDQARFEASGAYRVLKKPFDAKDLRSMIKELAEVEPNPLA